MRRLGAGSLVNEAKEFMIYITRTILLAVCLTMLSAQIFATTNEGFRIDSIPRPDLEKLYEEADLVAFIKIVSGDTENYEDTIYKSSVTAAFKGTDVGKTVFFGPYVSYGVGSEYLIFLLKSGKAIGKISTKDKESRTVVYDDSSEYFRVMYGGYSILPISYECAFGPVSGSDSCDYAINAETVLLPKTLKSFPEETRGERFNDAFVRRSSIETFLNSLKKKK
jgi:hypothetical protein